MTPTEMAAVDAAAAEPLDRLIERAGAAVAWAARRELGGVYGRRVAIIAGGGNNGADGRVAARRLRRWGARVALSAPDETVPEGVDLVIDAAYGTGLSRPYVPPEVHAPVLAVDIPSGVDGLTGTVAGGALRATHTITFQALKPGLVLYPGADLAGTVSVVDLGLDLGEPRTHLVETDDVRHWVPSRARDAHKWKAACWVIAGSTGMTGAAALAAGAAARSGAGYVRLSIPGDDKAAGPVETVGHRLAQSGWGEQVLGDVGRFGSVVVGPGLGRDPGTLADVRAVIAADVAMVLDGDALTAIGSHHQLLASRTAATVLTPHDGEFETLAGHRPGPDRIAAARSLASSTRSVVLLKGPTTVVAEPDGAVLVITEGDQRLATAGSGDVLAGIIGSLLARRVGAFEAAAASAWIHGHAAILAPSRGMVASDLITVLPEVFHAADLG